VHAPEVSLRTSRFCSFGRVLGVRVDVGQWKMAESEK
jgi:hypothetical protein